MTLEVLQGEAAGVKIAVAGELLIGRASEGDGCLGGDPEISRRHAVLRRGENGALSIEDLGSKNGTFVNGARVTEATPLGSGDVVELGRSVLAVREVGAGPDIAVPGQPSVASAPEATTFPDPSEQVGSPTSIRTVPSPPPETARPADLIYDGRRVPVPPQGLAIGRTDDNDLAIATPLTSRRHARVGIREGRHFVADLGSANGTQLNGERLREEARWLNSGDTLRIGGESLRFVAGEATVFGESPSTGAAPRAVRVEGAQVTIGRDAANDVVLDDPNVSRFHAEIVAGEGAAELRDLASRNGTRVDGEAVTRARLEIGSEIRIGAFRLLFDGSSLLQRDDHGALRLRAEGLTVAVRDKVILNRADVELNPGEMVVVIGESGSGKSTMVKALAGVGTPTDGAVTVNGDPVTSRLTDIGYVPQDDIVHPHLTLLEALRYSARLRLPKDSSEEDIEEAVRRVLEELSLSEHAETRIGSLSGGQRKRAGMGSELLNRPSLFFLDEPTTGLDPGLETRMMELFRDLAEEGTRAVMVVTHATKNLALADKVCVMGRGGELAFFGPPAEAKEFFGVEHYDGIYTALDERPATEWRRKFEAGRDLPTLEDDPEVAPEAPAQASEKAPKGRTGAQTGVLVSRYLKLVVRDRRNLLILLGQVPVIALGTALLFQSGVLGGPGEGRPDDAAQLLFLLVTTSIWFGSIDGSREIIKEKALSLREQAAGVRVGPYLTSKAAVLFGLVTVQAFLLALVVFAIRPLDASAMTYLAALGTLMLTGFVAVGMGLLISASVGSEDQATSLIPLALIPQLLFAGAIVPVERMGAAISAISNLIFARWSFAMVGTEVDLNARFAAVKGGVMPEFGPSFFDLALLAGGAILLAFLALFFGAVYMKLARREG